MTTSTNPECSTPWPQRNDGAIRSAPTDDKTFVHEGRRYEILPQDPQAPLIVLQTLCCGCGRPFRFGLPRHWRECSLELKRLCLNCARPDDRRCHQGKIRTWRADDCQRARR